jgi:thiol-disulfide isomerase/thioredoxin
VLFVTFTVTPALALLPVGQTAPDFQLSDLNGNVHTLSDYRGKVVVFDFFEPYCGYCQQDTRDNFIPLYNTYYKDNANVQFFSIETSGASVSEIQSIYLAATGSIPWPILTNGYNVASTYGIGVTPTVYVVDPAGNIAVAMPYPIDVATLKSTIDELAAKEWGPWTSLGGNILAGTSPAACSPASGQTDWFVVGTNHQLYYTSNGGSSWTSLGGSLTSSPAAVSPSAGVMDVFARDTTGALYTKHYSGSTWGAWTNLGGKIPAGTSPAACSWGASREDVFVQGNNGALYQNTWTGTWSGWTSLGGSITSSPAAVSPTSGVIDAFARGTTGALYTKHYSGGAWGAWTNLGGKIPAGTSPAVCSWGASREDVFVQGTNGALYQNTWTGTWSGWTSLGGSITSSPAATSPATGTIDVGVRGTTGALYEKVYTGG